MYRENIAVFKMDITLCVCVGSSKSSGGIGLHLPISQESLIFLARQKKLLGVINSVAMIESEITFPVATFSI